jgi:hypothetical protein
MFLFKIAHRGMQGLQAERVVKKLDRTAIG